MSITKYKWLPEQPTTEMVNKVFNKLGKEVDKEFFILMWKMMWQSAAEVDQEPIKYEYQGRGIGSEWHGQWGECSKKEYERYSHDPFCSDEFEYRARALYTHPQPSWKQESVKLTAVDDLMTRVSSTSPVLSLPDEVMSSEALFEFITNNPQPYQKPVGYADAESITYLLEGGDSGILIVPEPTDTRDTPLFTHPPKCEPLNEDDISKLIYWVHRLYAEIPDKKENYELFDEVNTSGVLMIDHFYDRLPKES